MPTHCTADSLDFGISAGRRLVGAFDGGAITSNGGVLLLGAADRTSTPTMRANQLRLWLSSLACVLLCAVRRIGLVWRRALIDLPVQQASRQPRRVERHTKPMIFLVACRA